MPPFIMAPGFCETGLFIACKNFRTSPNRARICLRSAIACLVNRPCLRALRLPIGGPDPGAPPCMRNAFCRAPPASGRRRRNGFWRRTAGSPASVRYCGRDRSRLRFPPRVHEAELPLTQEFLAQMMGVRRTSVTDVAKELQRAGTITYSRGRIRIVDLELIKQSACECNEEIQSHYRRIFASNNGSDGSGLA
jgi:hypothetical protein